MRQELFNADNRDLVPKLQDQWSREYLLKLDSIAGRQPLRVTDKNPFNFLACGLIHLVFPQALIIHCRRDPIDTCMSIFSTYFSYRNEFSTDLEDLHFYYRLYGKLMAHWRAVLPAERFLEVDYEALVADSQSVSRNLISACGLEWDPACLHPERNTRVVKSASKWQVRQPIYRTAVGRWHHYQPWIGRLTELSIS